MKTSSSAFNCTSTSTINAILQAARDINSPVIIQVNIDNVQQAKKPNIMK